MGMSFVVEIVGQQTLLPARPAHVGRSGLDFAEDGRNKPLLLHLFGQGERVAAPDADRFGPADEGGGVLGPVDRTHADAQFGETRLHLFFVIGVGERDGRVGNEDDFRAPRRENALSLAADSAGIPRRHWSNSRSEAIS